MTYSRRARQIKVKKSFKFKNYHSVALGVASVGLLFGIVKLSDNTQADSLSTANQVTKLDTVATSQTDTSTAPTQEVSTEAMDLSSSAEAEPVVEEVTTQPSEEMEPALASTYNEPSSNVSDITENSNVSQTPVTTSYTLSNGNTAGETGSAAAAQMAAATGVSQSTWEYIIARESNGNSGATNASGASGLFQTMPGWGSTATVQDQVNTALNVYNNQGLSAWGL